MTESVKVELNHGGTIEEDVKLIQSKLGGTYKVYAHGGNVVVDVPEATDAVDEITEKLNDAGVHAFVCEYPADERAVGDLRLG